MMFRAVPKRLPTAVGLAGVGSSCGGMTTCSRSAAGAPRTSQKGSTLVEVVLATVILSIMGAAIIGSINYGMFMMGMARENARATQVMVEMLESIRLYNWDEVTLNGFVPNQFTNSYDPQALSGHAGTIYYGNLTVSNVTFPASYATNMKQFTVSLSWTNAGRIPHYRELSTLVAQHGMQLYVF